VTANAAFISTWQDSLGATTSFRNPYANYDNMTSGLLSGYNRVGSVCVA
jgi:hypothetical protein